MKFLVTIIGILFFITNAFAQGKLTISGISSGGFMASQMGTIYSKNFDGIATVAGGVFYCAQDHFQQSVKTFGASSFFAFAPDLRAYQTGTILGVDVKPNFAKPLPTNPIYQAISICMGNPVRAHNGENGQMDLSFLKTMQAGGKIDSLKNIKNQKVLIYQGTEDSVVLKEMATKLAEFYKRMDVAPNNLKTVMKSGDHNFPTDKTNGINCDETKVPYIANCNYDLAGDILQHLTARKLTRANFEEKHLYRVAQKNNPFSIASYGYFYANDYCMQNPQDCDLHVALHGCEMSDFYDDTFNKYIESRITLTSFLKIQDYEMNGLVPQMGTKVFAEKSGYADYAETEKNKLMIYFPQTMISAKNYPGNPKGCWDWYGWTGSNYATNEGQETKWLMQQIDEIKKNPLSFVIPK